MWVRRGRTGNDAWFFKEICRDVVGKIGVNVLEDFPGGLVELFGELIGLGPARVDIIGVFGAFLAIAFAMNETEVVGVVGAIVVTGDNMIDLSAIETVARHGLAAESAFAELAVKLSVAPVVENGSFLELFVGEADECPIGRAIFVGISGILVVIKLLEVLILGRLVGCGSWFDRLIFVLGIFGAIWRKWIKDVRRIKRIKIISGIHEYYYSMRG